MTFIQRAASRKLALCAIATALLWWLSLQQLGLFALGWIALTPVLWACGEVLSPRARFFYGWRAGFLCFILHNWWLLPTITKSSVMIGVPPAGGALLGVLAVGLISTGHGLGVAILAAVWNPRARIFQRLPWLLPIIAALIWLAFDWARCQGELAHSWGALAYSQWRDAAFLQSASIIGQHGLSALCLWLAANLALWLRPEYSARATGLWRVPIAIIAILHFWGAWRIWNYDHTPREMMRVLLVQTNVSSLTQSGSESQFEQAERLTLEYSARGELPKPELFKPELVVWPETSAELTAGDIQFDLESNRFVPTRARHEARAAILARELGVPLLLGAQVSTFQSSGSQSSSFSTQRGSRNSGALSNRAVLFGADGSAQSRGKTHVVPFGERAPFGKWLPFLSQLAPEPPVVPETLIAPMELSASSNAKRARRVATAICFESCFVFPSRALKNQGAGVLFVLTNDEWFAGTNAPWEHAAMSTLRAVENGIPIAQAANGGYSFAIDGCGRFLAKSTFGEAQIIEAQMPLAR